MDKTSDMRVPVYLSRGPACRAEPRRETGVVAYLLEGGGVAPEDGYAVRFTLPTTRHFAGCACCAPRGRAAVALSEMYRARATGAAPYFQIVVAYASPAGIVAVQSALADDAVAAARFRAAP